VQRTAAVTPLLQTICKKHNILIGGTVIAPFAQIQVPHHHFFRAGPGLLRLNPLLDSQRQPLSFDRSEQSVVLEQKRASSISSPKHVIAQQ
jgi:hypothetical protein